LTLASRRADPLAVALSIALHALLVGAALRLPAPPARRAEPVDVEIVETVRPPPPPPAAPPPEPEPEPLPPPRPPPRRVLRAPVESRRPVAPPPDPAAAPPPSQPDEQAPPPEEPPQVGVTMSGGTTGLASPSGSTMYGRMPERAPDPANARPYPAEGTAPPPVVTSLPEVIDATIPPDEYPPQARREGREGVVKLRLVVGADGRVQDVRVVSDPGSGFGEAAIRAARRHFRFRPARVGQEPVATEIPFTVRFELP
jgi:protein TonB